MPFMKQGIAPISVVKCGCGETLSSTNASCPKCGKNLRPLSQPKDTERKDSASDQLLHLTQTAPVDID